MNRFEQNSGTRESAMRSMWIIMIMEKDMKVQSQSKWEATIFQRETLQKQATPRNKKTKKIL